MSTARMPQNRINLTQAVGNLALGPLDGRYRAAAAPLLDHLSEAALNRARLHVEVQWLIHLLDGGIIPGVPKLTEADREYLRTIVATFGEAEIVEMAQIEAETRHDVKAVEYFLKRRLNAADQVLGADTVLVQLGEVVHIFCTSEDINNLAYALTIRSAVREVWLPAAYSVVAVLSQMARDNADVPMLARTHGQPATPVTLGKELAVFVHRLTRQLRRIEAAQYLGKINGATGTYAAHVVALPQVDWPAVSRTFVTSLGLDWNPLTTQIESHDWQAELYADMARFNRILHNLATDVWTYISLGFFAQRLSAQGSTGSSTMPHKVNPIRFENAEANLEISCALLDSLGATLVTSRLQRDLTDSSTQRNIGVAFGHSLLALDNIERGLQGLDVAAEVMSADLDNNWEVLGEAIQQTMRVAKLGGAQGMADPYERLKDLTRGHKVGRDEMRAFVIDLGLPKDISERLLCIEPHNYTGLAEKLVEVIES